MASGGTSVAREWPVMDCDVCGAARKKDDGKSDAPEMAAEVMEDAISFRASRRMNDGAKRRRREEKEEEEEEEKFVYT